MGVIEILDSSCYHKTLLSSEDPRSREDNVLRL